MEMLCYITDFLILRTAVYNMGFFLKIIEEITNKMIH